MGSRQDLHREDSGAVIVVVAFSLLFLMAVLALALDGGRAFNERRADQNVADLAAISGAWAKCNGNNITAAATAAAGANGIPTAGVTVDPSYSANGVEVVINTVIDGQISPVIGADTVAVAARAVAACELVPGTGGNLPFGAPGGGGFEGILQQTNPCPTGNCRALKIPRADSNGVGKWFIRNVSLGAEPELLVSWGDETSTPVCSAGDATCTVIETDTGVSAGQLSDGLVRGSNSAAVDGRLENLVSAAINPWTLFTTNGGRDIDGDPHEHILEGSLGSCLPPPGNCPNPPFANTYIGLTAIRTKVSAEGWTVADIGWVPEVHGDLATVAPSVDRHVLYDGVVNKCASPRLANIPIVTDDLDWEPADGTPSFSFTGGSEDAKVIGYYDILIDAPRTSSDFKTGGSDTIKTTNTWIIWYGPNAICADGTTIPGGAGTPDAFIVTVDE